VHSGFYRGLAGKLMGVAIDGDATFKTNSHATQHGTRHTLDRLTGGTELMGGLGNGASNTIAGIAGVWVIVDEYGNRRHSGSLFSK
jgi:hypothetical protein